MTDLQPIDAPRTNGSTGPNVVSSSSTKTPEGKKTCRLNAYRHGLTGQLNILSPDEQRAYDQHSKITLAGLAPSGDFEHVLAQSIADDLWRLNRVRTIESSLFALGMQYTAHDTGAPQVDEAFDQAHTWARESHNLQLLTIYEQRIQRSVDKNMNRLEALRTRREQAGREDMRQAKLLYQLAQAEGRPYQPEAYFSAAPIARESVFSTPDVARELNLDTRLDDAKIYNYSGHLPKVKRASAGESAESGPSGSPKGPYGAASVPKPA